MALIKHIFRIERERRRLMRDQTPWHVSSRTGQKRTVSEATRQSTTPLWKCLILYWFAKRADKVLELGTGLGLSTAYLAAGCRADYGVSTVDIDPKALYIARSILAHEQVLVHWAKFDTTLRNTPDIYNLAYIDGDHEGANLMRYFKKLIPLMSPKGVIICDDVLWSEDMKTAWETIKYAAPEVRKSLRIHDLGILWLDKKHYDWKTDEKMHAWREHAKTS